MYPARTGDAGKSGRNPRPRRNNGVYFASVSDDTNGMEKVFTKRKLHDPLAIEADVAYWLSRPSGERTAAVDFLRAQVYGPRRQLNKTVYRIIRRAPR